MGTVLSMRFPAGRYHATPWGSHANEAEIEWPPSPWRILRALIASWHRKVKPGQFPEEALPALIDALSVSAPVYRLPSAVRAHSRHYMPVRSGAAGRPVLIFDAFARIDPADALIVGWPDVTLHDRERELLAMLAELTGYLGRAESWVEATLLDAYDGAFDCTPAGPEQSPEPGRVPVKLLAPLDPAAYSERRERLMNELGLDARRLTNAQKRIRTMLPPRLVEALCVETGDLRGAGWNLPPGGRMITYERPRLDAGRPARMALRTNGQDRITTVRLALAGRPLPRIEDAVRIGEVVRWAAIKTADRIAGPGSVPDEISGHGKARELNHQHAFYLPEDADADGFIDHVLIHAPGGLSRISVAALDRLHRRGLWTRDGQEWAVVFEGAWAAPAASRSRYAESARSWISVTPYLHPWFTRRGFGITDQIRRECAERGLPEPADIRAVPSIRVRDRDRRAVHFHRFRSKRGLRQPDSRGSLLEITFDQPVRGPLALGFGCHFGLGLFAPSI